MYPNFPWFVTLRGGSGHAGPRGVRGMYRWQYERDKNTVNCRL